MHANSLTPRHHEVISHTNIKWKQKQQKQNTPGFAINLLLWHLWDKEWCDHIPTIPHLPSHRTPTYMLMVRSSVGTKSSLAVAEWRGNRIPQKDDLCKKLSSGMSPQPLHPRTTWQQSALLAIPSLPFSSLDCWLTIGEEDLGLSTERSAGPEGLPKLSPICVSLPKISSFLQLLILSVWVPNWPLSGNPWLRFTEPAIGAMARGT